MQFATTIDAIADRIEAEYMPYPLDADGVPCKVGDLMETDEHIPRKVVGYYLAYPEYPCVTLEFVSPSVESYKLHHVKHDTQEQIDADAELDPIKYCAKYGLKANAVSARQHLLRRQRALDGRSE